LLCDAKFLIFSFTFADWLSHEVVFSTKKKGHKVVHLIHQRPECHYCTIACNKLVVEVGILIYIFSKKIAKHNIVKKYFYHATKIGHDIVKKIVLSCH
jgi:hypothetical protein